LEASLVAGVGVLCAISVFSVVKTDTSPYIVTTERPRAQRSHREISEADLVYARFANVTLEAALLRRPIAANISTAFHLNDDGNLIGVAS
jgi:hypothetical protein